MAAKETVICVHSNDTDYMLSLIERINKNKASPFHYKTYYIPATNEEEISKCIKYVKEEGKDCVISFSDTSSYVCAFVNERLGYPSPSPMSDVVGRDKYRTRMLVSEFEWCYGFNLGDPVDLVVQNVKTFPCMLKPALLFGGKGAFHCNDEPSLRAKLLEVSTDNAIVESVQALQNEVVPIPGVKDSDKSFHYMVEEFIETNGTGVYQYCMDVFVTRDGKIIPYSIFEEFLFQDGMFLGFVIPPIHFDGDTKPFEDYAIHIGNKLFNIGFKNQCFNIEMWRYPDGKFRLVEINPRVATPFVDLYEQYSGNNMFNDVTDLFLHNKEPTSTPLSVLKDRIAANTHEEQFAMSIDFSSRAMGVVSSIFNYDLLVDLSTKGYVVLFYTDRDCVLTEANATKLGKVITYVTIKGTWNEIVKEEKSLREKLYMGLPQYSDCFKYPKYFTVK